MVFLICFNFYLSVGDGVFIAGDFSRKYTQKKQLLKHTSATQC